ncbi:3-oxoacyl-ACP reductase FabG [Parabacteroides bouchesdurhonensis]|uniref:3-oxoacyl-ACP reductase FabG n=1 Tax=Parabacteroides bouchesdurhonensis TaxID=1936995 RepID=UPI000C83A5CB|nr:3-oxoacyl-ACP reductase FabG [Parabacteroides bouchesdurhonensis]
MTKKYALVTGGSRGIGSAICVKLAQMGYNILINYVDNSIEARKTLELVHQTGGDGEILMFDVSKREQVVKAIDAWEKSHPEEYIEVLVNNAGIRSDNVLVFMPEEDWHRVIDITLNGFYNMTQALLQPMLAHKYGRIINLASVSGLKGQPGQTNYSAAKGGIIAATKALAQEVARKQVTVNAVAPGFIETDMTEGLDVAALKKTIPAQRFGTSAEVAELVGFLASPQAGYITGEVISINGGLYT